MLLSLFCIVPSVTASAASTDKFYDIESAAKLHYYQRVYCYNKNAGFEDQNDFVSFNAGNAWGESSGSYENLGKFLDNGGTPYVAYVMNAPTAGSYEIKLRYALGCTGKSTALTAYYDATGAFPYAAVAVNQVGNNTAQVFNMPYTPMENGAVLDNWWVTGSITAQLQKGYNILYLFAPTSEMRAILEGVFVDWGSVWVNNGLTIVKDVEAYTVGDASGDSVVDVHDILRVKKYLANNSTRIDVSQVDFNNNGSVDANDLAVVNKIVVNPESCPEYTWLKVKSVKDATSGFTVTRSNPDTTTWLVKDSATVKKTRSSGKTNLDISIGTKYQTVDGFGASLTNSTAQNFALLSETQLNEVMTDLFSKTEGDALGLSFLRQPIGASDFADPLYTYDDMPQGQTDTNLNNFSIKVDTDPISVKEENKLSEYGNKENGHSMIDFLNMAKQKSGNSIKFFATPWTAPLWMKTAYRWNTLDANGKALNNTLQTQYYDVYARYLVKYLTAYKDQGIDISYMSLQNEPSARHGITSMYMSGEYMKDFVKNNISGKVNSFNSSYGKNVQLVAFDFNYGNIPEEFITDEMMNYYGGIAFHAYNSTGYNVVRNYANRYSNKKIFISEAAGNTSKNSWQNSEETYAATNFAQSKNYFCNVNRTVATLRNKANEFNYWNIMLNEQIGPASTEGGVSGNPWGIGLYGYNRKSKTYYKTEDYYALAHFSKFIKSGATVLQSTECENTSTYIGFNNIAVQNPDGSYAMVINNDSGCERPVSINTGLGYYIEYTVPGRSTVSLTWTAGQLAAAAN